MVDPIEKDYDHLSEIAVHIYHGNRGSFLKAMADTWLKADPWNKRILRQAWVTFIEKYDLILEVEG